jgi:hypothetical protein
MWVTLRAASRQDGPRAVSSAPTTGSEAAPAKPVSHARARLITSRILVVLVTLLALLSVIAGYVRYQALDTDTVESTASELIAQPSIRDEVAAELVDGLYSNVNVSAELRERLPADQKGLAGPIAGALRELSDRAAARLLERPRVQKLWVASVATAHRELVKLLDDRGTALRTTNGVVVLNLRPLVIQLGDQIAIVGDLGRRLPPDTGQITIMKSDQLRQAQRATHLLDTLGRFLPYLTLLIAALAVWIAAGRRRETLRGIAIGAIVAGLLVVVLRGIVGNHVVDALTATGTSTDPARDAWNILTSLLKDGGLTLAGLGVIALVGVWYAGETRSGIAARRELAPLVARWEIAYGAAAVFLLLLVWWGPTAQLGRAEFVLVFALLLGFGVWALRRMTMREHPDAANEPASAPFRRLWDSRSPTPPASTPQG